MVDGVAVEADVRVEPGRVGLVRDVAQRSGLRARAVQRALRPGQRLDALDVDQPDLRLQRALRQRLLVEVDGGRGVGDEGRRSRRRRRGSRSCRGPGSWRCSSGSGRSAAGRRRVLRLARSICCWPIAWISCGMSSSVSSRLRAVTMISSRSRGLVLREDRRRVAAGQRDGDGVGDRAHRQLVVGFLAHEHPSRGLSRRLRG